MAPGLRISRISSGSARGLSAEEFVEPVSEIVEHLDLFVIFLENGTS